MPRVLPSLPPLPGQAIERDRARHEAKLGEALTRQLQAIVGQTPVLTSPDHRSVVVPIKELQLPRFRRQRLGSEESGIGTGPGAPGDIVAEVPKDTDGPPGSESGDATVEVLIDLNTLQDLVFQDLRLPRLTPRPFGVLSETAPRWTSQRDRGPHQRLDRVATMKASLRRRLMLGRTDLPLARVDLRYRSWRSRERPITQAVVGLIRDVSGSMDADKVYLAHVLSWWVVSWLRRQYTEVHVDFWLHHTEAWRVDERQFFGPPAGGGTRASSAYRALVQAWSEEFPPSAYNRYVLHFSDGDDVRPDEVVATVTSVQDSMQLWALAELRPASPGHMTGHSALGKALRSMHAPSVRVTTLADRGDVYRTLHELLGEEVSADE